MVDTFKNLMAYLGSQEYRLQIIQANFVLPSFSWQETFDFCVPFPMADPVVRIQLSKKGFEIKAWDRRVFNFSWLEITLTSSARTKIVNPIFYSQPSLFKASYSLCWSKNLEPFLPRHGKTISANFNHIEPHNRAYEIQLKGCFLNTHRFTL